MQRNQVGLWALVYEEVAKLATANDVASTLVARTGSFLTGMQLQKLLYYVQAWHVAVTDEPLFTERFKAWADGPVVPQIWHAFRDPGTRVPSAQRGTLELDDLTSDLIDLVIASYGSMSGDELSALTHAEVPWREARGNVPDGETCTEAIDLQVMADFYRSSRKLGGRTAADLAAGGVCVRSSDSTQMPPLDIDAFLASMEATFDDTADDEFGGANLAVAEPGESQAARHTYMSA